MMQDRLDPPLRCGDCGNLLYDPKYKEPEHMCPTCGACAVRQPPPGMEHCSEDWIIRNKANLLELLPETWTHFSNVNKIAMMYRLKLLGLNVCSDRDLASCLARLDVEKLLLRDGLLIRRANI